MLKHKTSRKRIAKEKDKEKEKENMYSEKINKRKNTNPRNKTNKIKIEESEFEDPEYMLNGSNSDVYSMKLNRKSRHQKNQNLNKGKNYI